MGKTFGDKRAAQREANRQTANGRVHKVESRTGFFGPKHTVRNTGRIANPVQRRQARLGR